MCIFSVLEPSISFGVVGNHQTHRLQVVRRKRNCLHLYWYLIDPNLGWMHVRIQTWAPYSVQIYVNGREWMCRQLAHHGIAFERSDNKIVWVSDFDASAQLAEKFKHTDWPALLIRQVARVNPLLPQIAAAGFDGYWFGIDQAELATDILFQSRIDLERIHADLEVTGVVTTPDGTAMFVGIQHPGEDSTASNPTQYSNWPQSQFETNSAGDPLPNTPGKSRPRSTVLVITKDDGGVIGT